MAIVPQEIIQRILDANDIVDVIGSYVPLKRAGVNFKALSPFKKEKTPSFIVSPQKQIFKCFASGNGGDVIRFVQMYEGVSFGEALKILAGRAGIEIPRQFSPNEGAAKEEDTFKDILYEIHEKLSEFYGRNLFKDASAQIARDYLKNRGVSQETAKLFCIGYSPDSWDASKRFLMDKGYPLSLIYQAGLLRFRGAAENAKPTDNPDDYYDTFRGRLMFTISNSAGKAIAFSARDLKGETEMGKYINSPESPLFKKSRELYGLHLTKRPLLDEKKAIICEGQLDLIAIYQAGFQNVVASQGTAFTELHGQILKRYVDEVILCFDSDSAGVDATIRSVDYLIESDLNVRVASIPKPDDPDSLIRTKGPEQFAQVITQARDFFDFHYDVLATRHDARSPGGKKSICDAMLPKAMLLPNPIARAAVLQKVAARLGVPEASLLEQSKKMRPRDMLRQKADGENQRQELIPATTDLPMASSNRQMLHLLIHYPDLGPEFFKKVRYEWIPYDAAGILLQHIWEDIEHESFETVEKSFPEAMRQGKIHDLVMDLSIKEVIPARYAGGIGDSGLLEEVPEVGRLLSETAIDYEKGYIQGLLKERQGLLAQGNISLEKQLQIQKEVIDLQRRLKDITRPS